MTTLVVFMLIPIVLIFFGRCLTELRHRRRVYSLLHFLLIIFKCNQLVNPSTQVGIFDRILLSRYFYYLKQSYKIVHPPSFLHLNQNVLTPESLTSLNQPTNEWKPERQLTNSAKSTYHKLALFHGL